MPMGMPMRGITISGDFDWMPDPQRSGQPTQTAVVIAKPKADGHELLSWAGRRSKPPFHH